MDSLINEAKKKGGIPSEIEMEPKEAVSFLKEVVNLNDVKKNITIVDKNGVDIRIFRWNTIFTNEHIKNIITKWYEHEFIFSYKGINIKLINNKKDEVKAIPESIKLGAIPAPLGRIIKEGSIKQCVECGSSLHMKWIFWNNGCLHPRCKNYYAKITKG